MKCPNCTAKMRLDPAKGLLVCDYFFPRFSSVYVAFQSNDLLGSESLSS